jgi:hypothetical protein
VAALMGSLSDVGPSDIPKSIDLAIEELMATLKTSKLALVHRFVKKVEGIPTLPILTLGLTRKTLHLSGEIPGW